MKEYGPRPPLRKMTKEEKLLFGAKLIESRERLKPVLDSLSVKPPRRDPINVYDVFVLCRESENFAECREESVTAFYSDGYDEEMRSAGLARCRRLRTLIRELIDERLAEIDRKLAEI